MVGARELAAVKNVTLFEGNQPPLPTHQATISLFDRATGRPAARSWTARTSPRCARPPRRRWRCGSSRGPDARSLLVVGGGVQARRHLEALPLVREFYEIAVWSRRGELGPVAGTSRPRCAPPT